jgi:hypothetical protein
MVYISDTHRLRLEFIEDYILTMDMGQKFASDQLVTRKVTELERAGLAYPGQDENDDDYWNAHSEIDDVHIFASEAAEMLRAQLFQILWTFIEQLFLDALKALAYHYGVEEEFDSQKGKRKNNLVRKWRLYLRNTLNFEPTLTEQDWGDLEACYQIRNFITHSTHRPGHPPKPHQRTAVERLDGLKVVPDGIAISTKFLESFHRLSKKCLHAVGGEHWRRNDALDLPR